MKINWRMDRDLLKYKYEKANRIMLNFNKQEIRSAWVGHFCESVQNRIIR